MVNSVFQSILAGPSNQLCATEELSSTQGARDSEEWDYQCTKHATLLNNSASRSCAVSGPSLSLKSMTPLERSQNFYPESYTTDALVPLSCLIVNSSWEQLERVDFKTNVL